MYEAYEESPYFEHIGNFLEITILIEITEIALYVHKKPEHAEC